MPVGRNAGQRSWVSLLFLRTTARPGALLLPCPGYLEEGESCPLELLRTLGRLDKPHEASFPDLQDKKRGGNMLWDDRRVKPKRVPIPLHLLKAPGWGEGGGGRASSETVQDR